MSDALPVPVTAEDYDDIVISHVRSVEFRRHLREQDEQCMRMSKKELAAHVRDCRELLALRNSVLK